MEAIWNANPTINMLYCFEDGNCFVRRSDAAAYSKTTGSEYVVKLRSNLVKEQSEQTEIKPQPTKNKK